MGKNKLYLDYNATTPIRPEVKRLLIDDLELYGNASSMHEAGRRAAIRIEEARQSVAALIGASAENVIFTSGGSESNNTVFHTMEFLAETSGRNELIISAIEHPCVSRSAEYLKKRGFRVHYVPVDFNGFVRLSDLEAVLSNKTVLVSLMLANNEIGVIQDLAPLIRAAKKAGALFHTDAVQAVGKIPVAAEALGVDYLSLSSHKIYGPKGVGALYARKGAPLEPLIHGGHQEHGLRAGTYNNSGILGFGLAAKLAQSELADYATRLSTLRRRLREGLLESVPNIKVNGHQDLVLPNTLNVSFPGAEGESILLSLDMAGIEVSTGSACASGSLEPSPVLLAIGLEPELAHGSIRFSLGRDTKTEDIDYVLETLPPVIARLRSMSTIPLGD